MHWYIIAWQIFITCVSWKLLNYFTNRSPSNIINGIILPKPDDIRWIDSFDDYYIYHKLGNITIEENYGKSHYRIYINNIMIVRNSNRIKKYTLEVRRQCQIRHAKTAINETKFLELE